MLLVRICAKGATYRRDEMDETAGEGKAKKKL